jgi:ligand-binding sensor domain-containing protein
LYIFVCFFLSAFTAAEAQQFFFKNYSVESGLPFVQVACMYQDDKGYLWSGGYGGLSRFDGKTFLNYNRKHGLIDRNVNAICTDETGAVFIATNKGLSVLKDKRFVNYSQPEGLLSPYVNALCRRDGRSVYLGTSNGLYLFSAQLPAPFRQYAAVCRNR